jgi:hypothetical protein
VALLVKSGMSKVQRCKLSDETYLPPEFLIRKLDILIWRICEGIRCGQFKNNDSILRNNF